MCARSLFSRAAVNGCWKWDSRTTDCFPWDTLTTMRTRLPLPTRGIEQEREREKERRKMRERRDPEKNTRLCKARRRNDESSVRRLITDPRSRGGRGISRVLGVGASRRSFGTSAPVTCCIDEKEKCAHPRCRRNSSKLLSLSLSPSSRGLWEDFSQNRSQEKKNS